MPFFVFRLNPSDKRASNGLKSKSQTMKKVILACFALLTFAANAQEKNRMKSPTQAPMSAEQRTNLKLKELTLALDLNASQQKDMEKLLRERQARHEQTKAEMQKRRAEKSKADADTRYELKSKRLDARIAEKERVKKILNPDQYAKWEALQERHKAKAHQKFSERRKARR